MRVECVSNSGEVLPGTPGVIVFPEYCDFSEIRKTAQAHPDAVVVGAVKDGIRSRALLVHGSRNWLDYLKVGSDGRTEGTGIVPKLPVYELPHISVGILICMDVQCGELVQRLVQRVEHSTSPVKLICIPAFMGSEWFSFPVTNAPLNRVHVALCNHPAQDRPRCKSFIADATGAKVCQQSDREPICWEVA